MPYLLRKVLADLRQKVGQADVLGLHLAQLRLHNRVVGEELRVGLAALPLPGSKGGRGADVVSSIAASNCKTLDSDLEVVGALLGNLASLLGTLELLLPGSLLLAEDASLVLELGFPIGDGGIAILAALDQNAVLFLQAFELEAE